MKLLLHQYQRHCSHLYTSYFNPKKSISLNLSHPIFYHKKNEFATSTSTSTSTSTNNKRKQKTKKILQIESPTFDGKWILPSHIHLPAKSSLASSSSSSKSTPMSLIQPPILLICGWAGAGTCDWGAIPTMLAHRTNRNVITFDPRGIGNSRKEINNSIQDEGEHDDAHNDRHKDRDGDELSMECMALDALAVIQKYYQFVESSSRSNTTTTTTTTNITTTSSMNQNDENNDHATAMEFCVGGASMGGMVAQYIIGLTASISSSSLSSSLSSTSTSTSTVMPNISQNQCQQQQQQHENMNNCFRVTSLGLICTSTAKHIPNEYNEVREQKFINLLEHDHFLHSFDTWPTATHTHDNSNNTKNDNNNDNQRRDGNDDNENDHHLKEQCINRFFQAMGSKFLSKPGRKALQKKLMKSFIDSRKNFINHDNRGVLNQKKVLLKHVDAFGDVKNKTNIDIGIGMCDDSDANNNNMDESQRNSQDDHFLDIVKERKLPYVIVHGEDDSVISVNHAKMMHSFLSSQASYRGDEECKNLFILEECDHLCWITHGHEVVDILGEFWSDNITKE